MNRCRLSGFECNPGGLIFRLDSQMYEHYDGCAVILMANKICVNVIVVNHPAVTYHPQVAVYSLNLACKQLGVTLFSIDSIVALVQLCCEKALLQLVSAIITQYKCITFIYNTRQNQQCLI